MPNMQTHEIQSAINEAEAIARPLAPKDTPITINNGTLLALIEAAKELLEERRGC